MLTMKSGRNVPKAEGMRNGPLVEDHDKNAWDYYNDNMKIIEADREKEWEETMNTILIVASLLAALVAAFLIETTKLLQEDPNDVVKAAIIHLSAQYNNSAIGRFEAPSFKATAENIVLNTLLLISLALNLVAAVVAMLVKQWNREFDRGLRLITDPKSQALRREFRMLGLDAWHLSDIVNFVPILVLLSVFFFILGIFIYHLSLHQIPSWTFLTVSGATVLIYIITVLISITNCQSPFRSAVSRVGYYLYVRLRARITPKRNFWESEDDSTLIEVNEKREQSHANHDTMIMAVFQRLSNITEIAPRNWHRFYSIAQQLVSDSIEDEKTKLTKHRNWTNLLAKIELGLAGKDGRGLFFLAAEKADWNMLKLLKEIPTIHSRDKTECNPLHLAAQNGSDPTWILEHMEEVEINGKDTYGQTPLSLAAVHGHTEVVQHLISQERINVNCREHRNGQTPLSLASVNGHKAVVHLLLTRCKERCDLNARDYKGRTPLSLAVKSGHKDVVRLLLAQENVNLDGKDQEGWTPLSYAVSSGHNAIAWMILNQKGHNFGDNDDDDEQPPLIWAAKTGSKEAVGLLLACEGIEVNCKDTTGQTPLSLAASNGHDEVVKLLVSREDVDINTTDKSGRTPLFCSVYNRHGEVARLLLARQDVDINICECEYDRSAFLIAAKNGDASIVRMLLASKGVKADSKDRDGRTPLSWAAQNGHTDVARLLLEHGEVNLDSEDNNGRAPISWVDPNGDNAIFWIILERKGIEVPPLDKWNSETPLLWAAMNGIDVAVKQLLSRPDIDVNPKGLHGRTPLSWAAFNRHETTLRLLLERPDSDPNAQDYDLRTSLSRAAQHGNHEIVRQLLAQKDLQINVEDEEEKFPLYVAVRGGHEMVVRLLLERQDLDVNCWGDVEHEAPFSQAVKEKKHEIAKLLLARQDMDIKSGGHGKTLLVRAAQDGLDEIADLLLRREDLNPNFNDKTGRSPLLWAVLKKNYEVVKLFLARQDLDVNIRDGESSKKSAQSVLGDSGQEGKAIPYRTSLSWAAGAGLNDMVQLLLTRRDVDVNAKNSHGLTPLIWASRNGHSEAIQLLLAHPDIDPDAKDAQGQGMTRVQPQFTCTPIHG